MTTPTLSEQIQRIITELELADLAHDSACLALSTALVSEYEDRLQLEYEEAELSARLYSEGVPGKNEAERKAFVAVQLLNVGAVRTEHEAAVVARIQAEHDHRRVDVRQKRLRATLAALTALCGVAE
jgi:hypothetical protein